MDATLIERAKQGDEEAFRELLLTQIPSLEAMIQAKLNPTNRAVETRLRRSRQYQNHVEKAGV